MNTSRTPDLKSPRFIPCLLALLLAGSASRAAESLGFRVPAGFSVSHYADDDLAHDIFSMTIDARGRVVVSGKGYVKFLEDTDRDGKADRAILFSDFFKKGAHGMYFEGNDLIAVGNNAVWRLRDEDGDSRADGQPEKVLDGLLQRGHSANGVIKGPDGWYYVACGNDSGVNDIHASLPGSPVKRVALGGVVRIPPEGIGSEVYAHGFRNPYDLAFDRFGQLFTVDADGERDQYLPWYSPNRLYDIALGRHHGWILRGWVHAWNPPEYWIDNVSRLREIGRGSPTGMLAYRHRRFPARYTEGVFSICWTYGRIYFFPLERYGSGYRAEQEIFLETTGDTGFAPVDMAVHPNGDLFVAVGGRGTRGSVFRIQYHGEPRPAPESNHPLREILGADQPLTSWSRAQWVPLARAAGKRDFERAILNDRLSLDERLRAVEILVEVFGGIDVRTARKSNLASTPELTARGIWALSRSEDSIEAHEYFSEQTHHRDPRIQRAAWEALTTAESPFLQLKTTPNWMAALDSSDRRIRSAVIAAAQGQGFISFDSEIHPGRTPVHPRQWIGFLHVYGPDKGPELPGDQVWRNYYWKNALHAFRQGRTADVHLNALRLLELALGDVKLVQDQASVADGYAAAAPEKIGKELREEAIEALTTAFPSNVPAVNFEIARVLAMLEADNDRFLSSLPTRWGDGTPVEDDIHFLLVASRIPAKRDSYFSERSARALAMLHRKMRRGNMEPSRFWPSRVGECFDLLLGKDPLLAGNLVKQPAFGLPEHSLFAQRMPAPEKLKAARQLLAEAVERERQEEPDWSPALIELCAELPADECLPQLRRLWDRTALRDAVALALAKHARPDDRGRLIEALQSVQTGVVAEAAGALAAMGQASTPDERAAALKALRRFDRGKPNEGARKALNQLLETWTENPGAEAAFAPWLQWFKENQSAVAGMIDRSATDDLAGWEERLAGLEWAGGDADRGKTLFEARACHRCHSGNSRMGPRLNGIAGRFTPTDLFLHTVDPNRDISPAYKGVQLVTTAGETHIGALIYESPAATLLQISPETTLRFQGSEIARIEPAAESLMPAGLLEGIDDQGLTDLHAYLKTLK